MTQRVAFIVTELGPDVDPFMLHIHAAVVEQERNRIAQRTREVLAAARRAASSPAIPRSACAIARPRTRAPNPCVRSWRRLPNSRHAGSPRC
jgi:DNA invertase Pin-like site-specific DNA recombinase